jgi:hypothetical protein
MNTLIEFETVWNRIRKHQGETFVQIRGGEFKYKVVSGVFVPDRTQQQIPKSHFEEAFCLVPLANTVLIQHLRGPSYIYAVLMDSRIRATDW